MSGSEPGPGTSAPAVPPERGKHRRIVIAVAIVAIVVVAGSLGSYYYLHRPGGTSSPVVDDGPNFYQALGNLNASAANESGGPWSLFSVVGIASEVYFSPNVISYYTLNASSVPNSCQASLSGLTMFNGTIPLFSGTFNSGTAPFWQFAFYSNTREEVLVGTDVLGTTHLSSPFLLTNACVAAWYEFLLNPSQWAGQIYSNSSLPVNSPEAAQIAWSNLGTHFAESWVTENAPLAQMYILGPAMLERTFAAPPGGNWNIDFLGCGLAGYSGTRGISYAGVSRDGQYSGDFNGTENCALLNQNPPGEPSYAYDLPFSSASRAAKSTTQWITVSYQVNATYTNGSMAFTDVWGLANWMTSWDLANASGGRLPPGVPECLEWVPTVTDCMANALGWYTVILSASGGWVNSYGALPGGGFGWAEPVTALVSHQQLVIVTPSSWNVSGDLLSVSSAVPTSTVLGSITL